ncbi:MAG: PKD domain-containing protein [Bacteroidetes bacterium]|nr:PKD domain-containing protein [Bacteroidota bacterium]
MLFTVILILYSSTAFAQPANDDPCNATPLTAGANCNYSNSTNNNATNTPGVPNPGCATYLGADVWFSVTVPASGSVVLDSRTGGMTDGGMAVYSGTCNALTLISCDDDGSTNGLMPSLTISNRPPGSTLFIRFWSFAGLDDGTFGICATINTPLPPTNQDCPNAIPICQNVYNTAVSYSGEGNILDEIDPLNSCLGAGELNDVWYTFTVQTSGNLDFTITPNTITEDYDWAVYNLTNASCADIATDPSLSVSCNFSADPGATGPTGGSAQTSQDAFGTPFNAVIPVTAGETYVVNVSNFSTTQNGYQIDFGASTANIFDNIPPQLTSLTNTVQCGTSQLSFDFSENILCSTIQNGDFTVSGPGGPYTLSNWTSVGCSGGGQYGQLVTVNVNPPITASGNFQLCLTNASASVTDLCGNVAPPSCLNFTISPILVNTNHTNLTCNGNSTGSVTVAPTTGVSPYTYVWTPNVGTTASLTNLAAGTYTATITDANGCTATTSATVTQPTLVSGAINPTQPTCGSTNGSATVVPSGGTGPYTYVWSPTGGTGATANNLGSGNFSVTITDSQGCTGSSNINLAAPASPIASISSITNSSCQSPTGNITVAVNGGTGPFTYSWSPSGGTGVTASNLQPGSYTCIVTDAAGCSSSATATIGAPVVVIATITASTPESCPGSIDGTATASGSNGTPAYTYAWSPSGGSAAIATGLSAGSYSVIITDATGCTSSTSVTISSSPAINASINSTPVLCNGSSSGSLTVNAGGGTGTLNYSWSPSGGSGATASNLTAGTYTVTVTDANGCTLTSSSTLTDPSLLTNSISSLGSICGQSTGSATVVASGGTAPYTYAWNPASTNSATITNLTSGQYSVTITDANNCTSTATVAVTDLPGPVATLSTQVDVSCNGGNNGSATVQVAGGSAPLTYSWSPSGGSASSATALSAGTYDVTVTDANGCTSTTQVTIVEPTLLNTSIATAVDLSCNGANDGSISITATGGTPTYSYAWTPASTNTSTITNLAAGSYSVLVTDLNGCTSTIATTIAEPTALTASTSPIDALCNGGNSGSATANVSGGTAGYTYLWSPTGGSTSNATNLAAGNYTVTITDANGCTTTSSATIAEPTLLTAAITGSTDASCFGGNNGSASVNANGGTANYTYLWSPSGGTGISATNLAAGNYSVVTTDANGCTASSTVTINEPTLLTTSSTSTPVNCNGGTDGTVNAVVSGGTSNYSFNWQPGNILTASASGLSAGSYTVTVTDANGCIASSNIAIIEPILLSTSTSSTPALCFGSSDGTTQANVSGGTASYTYSWFPSGGTSANAAGLTAGNYSVTVTDANGCTTASAVVVSEPAAISLSAISTPATCGSLNGTASANVSGGAGGYSYSWAPSGGSAASAANLAAGAYTVTATDINGCTASSTANVSNIGGPTINAFATANVSCFNGNDGTANSSVANGTGPFTYSWSPSGGSAASASNLSAGNYSVSVTDANGCTSVANFVITEPTVLAAQATSNPATCFGSSTGTTSVNVAGGTAGYSYLWTPGSAVISNPTGLTAGQYTVTVTDANGCTISATTSVTEPNALNVVTSTQPTLCFNGSDGSATANVSGGFAGYSYSWFPSGGNSSTASNLVAGNYSVTVTDANGCTLSATTIVNQPVAISLSTSSTPSTCGSSNGTATVVPSSGAAPFTYNWTPTGGAASTATNIPSGSYTVTVSDANGCTMTASESVSSLGGPTITAALVNDVDCFGGANGSATSNVTSGNGPYTYVWSPSGGNAATATNLSAGVYSISITDANGCNSVDNVVVSEPSAIVAQASSQPASCFGSSTGSASVVVAGGSASYTYVWTPGNSTASSPNGLTAGNYSVVVTDANGCTTTASTTINQPTQLSVNITPTPALCNGSANGSAQANVSGGTAGYSYSWFPSGGGASSALNLSAGTYTVEVTDANGCTSSSTTNVTQPAAMNFATSSTPATCGSANGTTNVVASGGAAPYTYAWSPIGGTNASATNLTANTYTVVVTDANGCTTSTSESVSNTGGPTIATNLGANVSCNGLNDGSASVAVSAGTAPFSYQWSPSGGNGQNATNLAAGNYSITVTDANGCISNDNISITEPTVLLSQISSTDANCAGIGGSATVIAAGGTTPYTYSWTGSAATTATASSLTGGNYTATVTDGQGCTTTASTTANQPGGIVTVANATPVSCFGGNNGSASVVANGGSGALSYSWSPSGGSNSSATNLTAGNYSVTVSDAGGCVSTAAVVVSQPLAMNLITNVTPSACGAANGAAGVVASGGNAPYQYSWSPSGGTNANAINLNAGNYIVTVTDANSCTSTASALVINTGGPTVTLNASTDANCFGASTGSASVNATGGNGPYTYSWSPYGGTGAAAANLGAGIYTVNTADANGCITAINITINEPTAITIQSTTTPSACGNPNGTATAHGFGGVGNYSYSWLGYTTTDSTLSNITSGNYSVTITDGNGCSATTGLSVGISNGANAILQSSTDVSCDGGSDGSALISASGGTAPYTYSWSPNGGTNASASGLSAGNYIVTVSDANNCSTTVNVVINDGAILVLQTASTPASCNGGLDGSANVVVNGGSSPYSYQWTGSSSTNSTASNLGIGNYTVTVTDANGCAEAEVATVNSATAIALNPVSSDLSCNGDQSGSASVSPVGGTPPYTYQWTGNVSTTDTATNLSGGLYTLIVTDVNGCASIENFNIIEPAAMSLSVSPAITVCIGQNTTLNAIVSGGSQPYVYQWSNGLNTDSISVMPSASTTYTVTVNDANGCLAGTQSISVSLNPPLSINASGPAGICGGEQVNLSSLATGGNGNYTYSWNNGLFNTANAIDNPTSDATYTVVVTDDCGTPSATAQVTVIVSPDPIVDFGPGNLRGCTPLTVNFDDRSTTLAGSTYTWTFGDSNNSSTQNPEHTYTAAGSYDVTLEVMNSFGCSSVLVMPDMINVYDSPVASFVSQPTEVTNLEPNVSFTNTTIGADYYTWDFGDGSANVNDENPMHAYTDTGTYLITLITINNAGCIDTVRGYVEVGDAFAIYIPNAFTPNFDDVNDSFNALGIGWADFNLYILDRWGLNLYHSTDREKPWDGTYLGDPCQSDTYVYKIQVHDTKGSCIRLLGMFRWCDNT